LAEARPSNKKESEDGGIRNLIDAESCFDP
jgi:hypothetical protein